MIHQGEIFLADFEELEPHPVVIVSREELNRGSWVVVALITSRRFEERSTLPNCLPLRSGEFGLKRDCVIQCESLFSLRREMLGEHLGRLDGARQRELVKALGNMLDSDCEPN